MAVNKAAGDRCYANIVSVEYAGPAASLYIFCWVAQGSTLASLIYAASAVRVDVPASAVPTLIQLNKTIEMSPTGTPIQNGLADAVIIVADGPDTATANQLNSKTFPGTYNFSVTYPTMSVRSINGSFS